MHVKLDELSVNEFDIIKKKNFNVLMIATTGIENYNYFKDHYLFPKHKTFTYIPTITIKFQIDKDLAHYKRYTQALEQKLIKPYTDLNEFILDPKKRISVGLPKKNDNLIIFDDYYDSGKTLDLCVTELVSIGYDVNKLFFTVGNFSPKVYSINQNKSVF